MTRAEIIAAIRRERKRQDDKWGPQEHPPERWMLILGEEYGEACEAAWRWHTGRDQTSIHYKRELIECAAVIFAALGDEY